MNGSEMQQKAEECLFPLDNEKENKWLTATATKDSKMTKDK